ncbi:MAG: preprotein translocase subunit SecE [Desulfobacterales bacterium]|nr:preprotein translocase subunit SecE [Desulfobacterales bacterium]
MSRIQKKKAPGDKKKKRVSAESGVEASSGAQVQKSTSAAIVKKNKIEKASDPVVGEPGFFQRAIEFFREVKVELKKVTWPTQKQTLGTTAVVIVFVFVVAAFLGLFDYSLSKLVQVVLT